MDAQQDVVSTAIVLIHIVAIVCRRDFNTGSLGNLQNVRNDLALFLQPVVVDLKKEAILTENVLIFDSCSFRLIETSVAADVPIAATISPATPAASAPNAARPSPHPPRPPKQKSPGLRDTGPGLLSFHRSCIVVAYTLPFGLYRIACAMRLNP